MSPPRVLFGILGLAFLTVPAPAQLPRVKVERQPLEAQVKRLVSALDLLGEPFEVSHEWTNHAAILARCLDQSASQVADLSSTIARIYPTAGKRPVSP